MNAADSGRAAELLREYRQTAGLSQRQLASAARISVGVIRDLEQRRTTRPHAESVRRLAEALGLDGERAAEFTRIVRGDPGGQAGEDLPEGLRLAVLGPLAAWRDGCQVALGSPMQRAVLGLLALTPNVPVPRSAIIDALWGDDQPASAAHLVQVYASRLRRLLDPSLALDGGVSFQLRIAAGQLDLTLFDGLAREAADAHAAGDLDGACDAYARALRLWRAEPLADLELLRTHPAVASVRQRRADLVIRYADAARASGRLSGLARAGSSDREVASALASGDPLDLGEVVHGHRA
jgi:transcriptional regulator with XRE-family HTH domain